MVTNRAGAIRKIFVFIIVAFWVAFLGLFAFSLVEKNRYPLLFRDEIVSAADNYGLERELLFAFVRVESGFDAAAKSSKGALGLMQILPSTGEFIAKKRGITEYDLYDEKTNIDFGAYYLKYLFERFNGLKETAAAYNAGEGTVKGWLKNSEYSTDGITLNIIPYAETERYVEKIYKSLKRYRKLYGKLLDK